MHSFYSTQIRTYFEPLCGGLCEFIARHLSFRPPRTRLPRQPAAIHDGEYIQYIYSTCCYEIYDRFRATSLCTSEARLNLPGHRHRGGSHFSTVLILSEWEKKGI